MTTILIADDEPPSWSWFASRSKTSRSGARGRRRGRRAGAGAARAPRPGPARRADAAPRRARGLPAAPRGCPSALATRASSCSPPRRRTADRAPRPRRRRRRLPDQALLAAGAAHPGALARCRRRSVWPARRSALPGAVLRARPQGALRGLAGARAGARARRKRGCARRTASRCATPPTSRRRYRRMEQSSFLSSLLGARQCARGQDVYTRGHSERVAALARAARARRRARAARPRTRSPRPGCLHDLGKIGVPEGVLRKPGPLTDEEWAVMRRHPLTGAQILAPLEFFARRRASSSGTTTSGYDGSGYPDGLRGDADPPGRAHRGGGRRLRRAHLRPPVSAAAVPGRGGAASRGGGGRNARRRAGRALSSTPDRRCDLLTAPFEPRRARAGARGRSGLRGRSRALVALLVAAGSAGVGRAASLASSATPWPAGPSTAASSPWAGCIATWRGRPAGAGPSPCGSA